MTNERENCPYMSDMGNCLANGGFCSAVKTDRCRLHIENALKTVERLKALYHNFLGYDLEKCVKYGNKNSEQAEASYSTVMMYEVAREFEDLWD